MNGLPVVLDAKAPGLEATLGAVHVELSENDLKEIDEGAFRLKLEGARLPEAALKMTGR